MQKANVQTSKRPRGAKASNFIGTYGVNELAYLKPSAKPYTVISLFSGAGGFDIGTSQAGFQTRVMVEWEKAACDTLRANFTLEGHMAWCPKKEKTFKAHKSCLRVGKKSAWYHRPEPVIMCEDITKLPTSRILEAGRLRVGECTLLTGGFPCQGFSTARGDSRNVNDYTYDKRNFLYLECVRIIREALPKTFCLENVPGLIQMQKGQVIRMICDDLAKVGYNVSWHKLNAADYGVPQNRVRVFFMGSRNDVMVFDGKGKKNAQYHIGGAPGTVTHPEWFLKKYATNTTKNA